MTSKQLDRLHIENKEETLFGRYIHTEMLGSILDKMGSRFDINIEGYSVLNNPIYSIKLGMGPKRVLLWSQMHGNESTTTKAVFDVLNLIFNDTLALDSILTHCTLCIIPILNPDGAVLYTRFNANDIDLNRDAQDLSQPESLVLRHCFENFKPNYCFNLHGQRTIYGVGTTGKVATLSFLSPAQDETCSVTTSRKHAMSIIADTVKHLQSDLKGEIGIYDDTFNLNCVGDTFQSLGVPTILFEAGHSEDDYDREDVRRYVFKALFWSLQTISNGYDLSGYKTYFDIPENAKCFYDIIINNALLKPNSESTTSIAIQFKEVLSDKTVKFQPVIEDMGDLKTFFAHKYLDAKSQLVLSDKKSMLINGNEIDFVFIKDEKILLKS